MRARSGITRIGAAHAEQDIVAVAHGGTIKAAIAEAPWARTQGGPDIRGRQLLGDTARSLSSPGMPAGGLSRSASSVDRRSLARGDASAGAVTEIVHARKALRGAAPHRPFKFKQSGRRS